MRTQLLPPFLADDFKWKLLEIMCHVVRALFARRSPMNKTALSSGALPYIYGQTDPADMFDKQ